MPFLLAGGQSFEEPACRIVLAEGFGQVGGKLDVAGRGVQFQRDIDVVASGNPGLPAVSALTGISDRPPITPTVLR